MSVGLAVFEREEMRNGDDRAQAQRLVPALVRAQAIMDEMCKGGRPKGVSELARALGLPKSSLHGLCKTLVELGMLARVGAAEFTIGPHVLLWANAFQQQSDLTQEFQALAASTSLLQGEALNLSILSGTDIMYVACRAAASPLGVGFRVGMRFPAAFTGTGKVIFSTMPREEVERAFAGGWPEPRTRNSITSLAEFHRELEETRARGYSVDNGQLLDGAQCFGAPIFDSTHDHAIAGVAAGFLAAEVSQERQEKIGAELVRFARELSRRLGHRPPS